MTSSGVTSSSKLVLKQALRKLGRTSRSNSSCVHFHEGTSRSCAGGSSCVRSLSSSGSSSSGSNNSFSSYIYPLRTEAPIVTRSNASTASTTSDEYNDASTTSADAVKFARRSLDQIDHFDDLGSFDHDAHKEALQKQQDESTPLKGSTAIAPLRPSHIPPNVPSTELVAPQTQISTLDNGIRVVSRETYGQVSTIGIVADVGSRHEQVPHQVGVAHLLDFLAFSGSTRGTGAGKTAVEYDYNTALGITQLLQDWGGTRFVNYGREQTIHCIDILRPNVGKAMDLLAANYLHPKFDALDIEDAKRTIEFQAMDLPQEIILEEAIQRAAYGKDQQLGKEHFCPLEALPHLNQDVVYQFWNDHILHNPNGLVVAGAGIAHDQLVEMAQHHFGSLLSSSSESTNQGAGTTTSNNSSTIPSIYRGGDEFIQKIPHTPMDEGMTRVGIAFELDGGWNSDQLVTACVLQTLLGGGNSFSAGGPGKGMYSRLYRQVLNRYSWVESAEAFTSIHNESGLWGISGSCVSPKKAQDLVHILVDNIYKLSLEHVTEEEINRARNMLKCNVLTQLESRLVLFEDLGRQVLTYGHREDIHETCRKIDSVTKEQIKDLVLTATTTKPPTIAAVGENLDYVPRQKELLRWFGLN